MMILDKIEAFGHENILSSHKTTIELTKVNTLTTKGNCIIGINATKACYDLNSTLKEKIRDGKRIRVILKVDDLQDSFYGFGNKQLRLLNKEDIVFRKSSYISNRTILVNCTKSSNDINRKLVEKLKVPGKKLTIILEINDKLQGNIGIKRVFCDITVYASFCVLIYINIHPPYTNNSFFLSEIPTNEVILCKF